MKKFKLIAACFAMAFCFNLSSSAQEVTTEDTKEKTTMTQNDADKLAKVYTNEMISALGITDKSKISTISSINNNYETALMKSVKDDMPEAEVNSLKAKLDSNRDKRLAGILSPEQMKAYTSWKQTRALEEMNAPQKAKSNGNVAKPSVKEELKSKPVKK